MPTPPPNPPLFPSRSLPKPAVQIPPRGFQVLVCDDEPSICNLLMMLLESAGFRVQVAVDGQDALQKIRDQGEGQFAAVITDNNMPRLDGLGLVKSLRDANYQGKILVLSGFLDPTLVEKYQQLRVDRILFKTTSLSVLGSVLKECLEEGSGAPEAKRMMSRSSAKCAWKIKSNSLPPGHPSWSY